MLDPRISQGDWALGPHSRNQLGKKPLNRFLFFPNLPAPLPCWYFLAWSPRQTACTWIFVPVSASERSQLRHMARSERSGKDTSEGREPEIEDSKEIKRSWVWLGSWAQRGYSGSERKKPFPLGQKRKEGAKEGALVSWKCKWSPHLWIFFSLWKRRNVYLPSMKGPETSWANGETWVESYFGGQTGNRRVGKWYMNHLSSCLPFSDIAFIIQPFYIISNCDYYTL